MLLLCCGVIVAREILLRWCWWVKLKKFQKYRQNLEIEGKFRDRGKKQSILQNIDGFLLYCWVIFWHKILLWWCCQNFFQKIVLCCWVIFSPKKIVLVLLGTGKNISSMPEAQYKTVYCSTVQLIRVQCSVVQQSIYCTTRTIWDG